MLDNEYSETYGSIFNGTACNFLDLFESVIKRSQRFNFDRTVCIKIFMVLQAISDRLDYEAGSFP